MAAHALEIKGHRILFLTGVLIFVINGTFAITCLSCENAVRLDQCTKFLECPDNKTCFIEKYLDQGTYQIVHRAGCRDIHDCKLVECNKEIFGTTASPANHTAVSQPIHPRIKRDLVVCTNCCYSDLCNIKGCGSSYYDENETNKHCFKKDKVVTNETVQAVVQCQSNELCSYTKKVYFGTYGYQLGCLSNKYCEIFEGLAQTQSDIDTQCCDTPLCNTNPLAAKQDKRNITQQLACPTALVKTTTPTTISPTTPLATSSSPIVSTTHITKAPTKPPTPTTPKKTTTTKTSTSLPTSTSTKSLTSSTNKTPPPTKPPITFVKTLPTSTKPQITSTKKTTTSTKQTTTSTKQSTTTSQMAYTSTKQTTTATQTSTTSTHQTTSTSQTPTTSTKQTTTTSQTPSTSTSQMTTKSQTPTTSTQRMTTTSQTPTTTTQTKTTSQTPTTSTKQTTTTSQTPTTPTTQTTTISQTPTTSTKQTTTTSQTPTTSKQTTTTSQTQTFSTKQTTITSQTPTTSTEQTTTSTSATTTSTKQTTTSTQASTSTTQASTTSATSTAQTTKSSRPTAFTTNPPTTLKPLVTLPPITTRCYKCAGPPESCGIAIYEDDCPAPNNYCINHVKNLVNGDKLIDRGCGNLTTCYKDWYLGSSDDDKCRQLDDNKVLTYSFECTYCCTKNNCNFPLHPTQDSLYSPTK